MSQGLKLEIFGKYSKWSFCQSFHSYEFPFFQVCYLLWRRRLAIVSWRFPIAMVSWGILKSPRRPWMLFLPNSNPSQSLGARKQPGGLGVGPSHKAKLGAWDTGSLELKDEPV